MQLLSCGTGLIEDDWFFPGCSDPAIVSGQQDLEEELTSVQGMGRLPQSRRKGNQAAKKPQDNYDHDDQRYGDPNSTLDSVDSAEGENMGGLQTVVEELELERNQLQEQIMALEERCQDLEDRLQLQVRIETLQNDNERLQAQLMQLRAQFSREADMHQTLTSSLNEQLKGLNDRKIFLETSLMEKEQKLLETAGKLEQINVLRHSVEEQTVLNKELTEKIVQSELQLEDAQKKYKSCESECAEMKAANIDLTDKLNVLKEKTSKQDLALDSIQRELDQTNEELERLNTSHLEERSQLIHDIQRCERENDNLKEAIEEKEKELASLSSNMNEYSEQLSVLKQQVQYKEEEIRGMEESIVKSQRENHLLRESQSLDVQESSMKMSALCEKLDETELELKRTKDLNEVQSKEAKELNNQINECTETIKDLRSQIQTHALVHRNHLTECEAQISLLKEQSCLYAQKLLEAETNNKQEHENLIAQLEENSLLKKKLGNLHEEKEMNTQSFEEQLMTIKDLNKLLFSEIAKKDEELIKLSKCLEEHIQLQETAKLIQQEKLDAAKSLEDSLKAAKQQNEDLNLKFIERLDAEEKKSRELKRQVKDQSETIDKMDGLTQDLDRQNKHLQLTLKEKELSLSDKIKIALDLTISVTTLENEKQQLIDENKSIFKQLEEKEDKVLQLGGRVLDLEKKLLINEEQILASQQTISLLSNDKEELIKKVDHVARLCEQKDTALSLELEKTKEWSLLSEHLSENKESINALNTQIYDMGVQLAGAKEVALEKENALENTLTECTTLHEQLNQSQEKIEFFQNKILELQADLDLKSKSLQEKNIDSEENKSLINEIQNELQYIKTENKRLTQWVEERDSNLKQKNEEIENLHQLHEKNGKENKALNGRLDMQCKEIDELKIENEQVLVKLSNQLSAYDSICTQMSQTQSEFVSLQQQLHTQDTENQKLKADLEITCVKVTQKTEEIAVLSSHLSQQAHTILALQDQIDSLNIEKQKMQDKYDQKTAIIAQREAQIQEFESNKLKAEGHSLQIISDLQTQLQSFILETAQLRQTIQNKESDISKQAQEIKTYKDKSEESDLFKVQLSENMEVISDLHFQIKNLNAKSEKVSNLIIEKDESLKKKVDDYVNLKAAYSEIEGLSRMQQKQIETLMLEENQMKINILEKDKMFKNAVDYTEELKLKLQDKELVCETLRQHIKRIETETSDLKEELNNQTVELKSMKVSMIEKESLIRNLNHRANEEDTCNSQLQQQMLLVSQLQSQLLDVTNEMISTKELTTEKEQVFLKLQEQCAAHVEKINELNTTLGEKEKYISQLLKSLNEKDINIQQADGKVHSLTNEIDHLREELDRNISALKQINSVVKEKEVCISAKQKTINSLTVNLEAVEIECRKNTEQISAWTHEIQQKDLNVQSLEEKCLEQLQHIENLKSNIKDLNSLSSKDINDKAVLLETLQQQVKNVVKERNCLLEDIRMLTNEKENLTAAFQKQLQQQSEDLKALHEKIEDILKESEVEKNVKVLQLKNEKEQLEIQVSVNIEELSALKLKVESLQVSLCESEGKLNLEHASFSQQNALLSVQLRLLENELTSRENTVQSLQQSLCLIDEKINDCESFSDGELIERSVKTAWFDNIVVASDSILEKLSVIIANIVAKDGAINHLKDVLSIKEKEFVESEEDHCKTLNLQKEKYQFEIKGLIEKMQSKQGALEKQEIFSEKNEQIASQLNRELKIHNEMVKKAEHQILNLLEEVRKKEEEIQNLTSQSIQQKDLISALSNQLKEKDASVSRVMESMSNEMVKFSEEKSILSTQIEHLESIKSACELDMNRESMNLENCRLELEHYKEVLSERETRLTDVMNEKDQLQLVIEKIRKEKDNLKRKLQASLVIRKDLLQKNEILARTGQDEIAKEKQKTDTLLKTIDELTHHLESSEIQKSEHESCQKLLKFQLLEKDSETNTLSEIIAAKESLLEQCQKNIKELNNEIAQKENELQEHLKYIQERDVLLNKLQKDLQEREKLFERCFEHPSYFEDNKSGIDVKVGQQNANIDDQFSAGDSCDLAKHSTGEINQQNLESKEKKIIPAKLHESQFDGKVIPKSWEEQDNQIIQTEKTNEHYTLHDRNQVKCKECECKHTLILSLQENLKYHEAIISEKEVRMDQCKLESEELMSEIARKEMQLEELNIKFDQLLKADEELKNYAREKSVEISEKAEEICRLKDSLSGIDHKQKQDKEIPIFEPGHQQKKAEASAFENGNICVMPEKNPIPLEDMKRENDDAKNVLETKEIQICHAKKQDSKRKEDLLTEVTSSESSAVDLTEIVPFQKQKKELKRADLLLEIKMLKETLQKKEFSVQMQQDECSKKDGLIAKLENQIQQQKIGAVHVGTLHTKEHTAQRQEAKNGEEYKSIEQLQKKLHAALISRRDVLKENNILKEELDAFTLEKHKLLDKISSLEHSLAEFDKDIISSLQQEKDGLVSELDRLLTENENLSAACESLKSTMETIVQEKEAFSVQLNSLQESQMVELSGWKAKHSEINKEYESLLQAYENISDEMGKMRHIIELTRKEKQEALQRITNLESKKRELEKDFQNSYEENKNLKANLNELIESKDAEIHNLLSETKRLNCLLKSTFEEQSLVSELTKTNTHLTEENNKLKEISENLKCDLQKKQKENDCLQNDIFASKSNVVEIHSEMEVYKSDMVCKFDDISNERQSLLNQVTCLTNEISETRKHLATIEQDRSLTLDKLKEADDLLNQKNIFSCKLENEIKHFKQHIISLNEKVRILEDDKCLLQEELENVQELSDKIKYEKEFLETEILNNIRKIDHLTDNLKAAQLQNSTLNEQLDDLKNEKSTFVRVEKVQQLPLVKESEEKVKEACKINTDSKNKSRELQELLKEKQQQIYQLQSDSIHFQELILSLERNIKLSRSDSEKYKNDLQTANNSLNKSHEDTVVLNEKLSSHSYLLNEANLKIASLTSENITLQEELKNKRNYLKQQKSEFEQMKCSYDELKLLNEEVIHLQKSHDALNQVNEKITVTCDEKKNELDMKGLKNKKLHSDINTNMASHSQSLFQNDRDRVLDKENILENQFQDTIRNKESHIKQSNLKIMLRKDELNAKVACIKELESKCYALEDGFNESEVPTHHNKQHLPEVPGRQNINDVPSGTLQDLERIVQTKGECLQPMISRNHSMNCQIPYDTDTVKEVETLKSKMMKKEQEYQRVLVENDELRANLQKHSVIVEQLKSILNSKDLEISMLISSKDADISRYVSPVKAGYRRQIEQFEKEMSALQFEKEQSHESNELRNILVNADKACQEQLEIANEIDTLKKPIPSLQCERDNIVAEPTFVEQSYERMSGQHKGQFVESRVKNIDLKQEVRNLLNEIDDLNSENAMLRAQLIRYREDLNQVLSLKDHQLKELLKQQLDRIKFLEQEKCNLQKEQKESQRVNTLHKEKIEVLELENEKVLSKNKDPESLIAILNRGNLVSETTERIKKTDLDDPSPVTGTFKLEAQDNLGRKNQHPDKKEYLEDMHRITSSQHDTDSAEFETLGTDEVKEKWILEIKKQNLDLKSKNKSFAKAMAALQNDRDRLIEDFKVLQSKYAFELKSEQMRGDKLEFRLNDLEARLSRTMELNKFEVVSDADDTLVQLDRRIKDLRHALANRDHEISELSSECGNYALQIDAFSKAMASLQDDRDRLLQQVRNGNKIHETKQGNTSITGSFDASTNVNIMLQNDKGSLVHSQSGLFNAEVAQLKSRVDELERALQQAKAYKERTDYEVSSYQTELSKLRTEKNSLLTEVQALKDRCHRTIAEKDSQIAELQTFHREIISKESTSLSNIYAMKALETSALVGNANIPDQVKQLLAEKTQLQNEMQRRLQEMHQREQGFQKVNTRGEMRAEVPPGAPQERASVIVEIDNMELHDLRKRLLEIEQHYESSQQEVSQLAEKLEEERSRREAAEEALLAEQQDERHGENSFGSAARDYEYAVQMESDDEREALIIDPREHVAVRKVKGGALSVRRWLRGRSIYCSKLLTSRSKSRYFFLTYLLTLHIVVFMCLAGFL